MVGIDWKSVGYRGLGISAMRASGVASLRQAARDLFCPELHFGSFVASSEPLARFLSGIIFHIPVACIASA
jgi:hypothetical protein